MLILAEGVFKGEDGQVWVEQPDRNAASVTVDEQLKDMVGQSVQLAMHQLPSMPLDHTKRGLGSCHVEGKCPCGHDDGNWELYNVATQGILHAEPWRIEQFDGTVVPLRFDWMVGHMGRMACASLTQLESLREIAANLTAQVQAVTLGSKVAK